MRELKEHLSDLLDQVKSGDEVLIMANEKVLAKMIPFVEADKSEKKVVEDLKPLAGQWLAEHSIPTEDVAEEMYWRR